MPKLTPQQAREVLAANLHYIQVPSDFCRDQYGDELTDYQDEILVSVQRDKVTAARSCHGSGKTFIASRAVSHFLQTHPNGIVITTAPTFKQVENQIWRYLNGLAQ